MTTTSYTAQNIASGRHIMPDLVRAFAILGIVLVNVAYFAYPGEMTYHAVTDSGAGLRGRWDYAAYFIVNAIFLFKSYTLFSFMFGVGVSYQIQSAQRRGTGFGTRYARRLLGLLILGIAHVAFAFIGDILIVYAAFGALLYLYRDLSVPALKRWAIGLMILQIALVFLLAGALYLSEVFAPEDMAQLNIDMQESVPFYMDVYGNGSFAQVTGQRLSEWSDYVFYGAGLQGPAVLSFFIWGLIAVKSGVLTDAAAPIWSKARRAYLPLGLTLNLIGAYLYTFGGNIFTGQSMLGLAFIVLGAPFSTVGYLGLIAKWVEAPQSRLKIFMARGGTATLSAYLLQSIILSFIFNGHGLGYYGKVSAAGCIAIALLVGLLSLISMSLWRKRFAYGPFEFVLRRFTYWGDNR